MPPTLPTTAPATTGGDVPSIPPVGFAVLFLPCPDGTLEGLGDSVPTPAAPGTNGSAELELTSEVEDSDDGSEELNKLLEERRIVELKDESVMMELAFNALNSVALTMPELDGGKAVYTESVSMGWHTRQSTYSWWSSELPVMMMQL